MFQEQEPTCIACGYADYGDIKVAVAAMAVEQAKMTSLSVFRREAWQRKHLSEAAVA